MTDLRYITNTCFRSTEDQSISSLNRQSSIYSLTLDEFQHALCEPGKNFGSMNMDEFLTNIWRADENQAPSVPIAASHSNQNLQMENTRNLSRQSILHWQGSLSLPAPLCRKTVEEVWSEIHKQQQNGASEQGQQEESGGNQATGDFIPGSATRQPTFGEMTLDDFLIKAGVVREGCSQALSSTERTIPQQQYGSYGVAGYQIGEGSNSGGGKRSNCGFGEVPYAGRISSGGGIVGFGGLHLDMGRGSPTSPVTSVPAPEQYKCDEGMRNGWRKQLLDSPVEKVIERQQRRMIKNRESAARSRARKQAYTVELEAELDQLRMENVRLKKEQLEEADQKRKRKLLEAINGRILTATKSKSTKLRRTLTGPW
ncbi:protein ABSCISIC ACID-INSENSITIVE 5-like [Aristolochia californica]|uniref:protein ABSCISIC ACID-INSENSITIVE 5-like n=1 Tax=Aristolochia californica TaxID=171875 RepID=UPI0035DA873E